MIDNEILKDYDSKLNNFNHCKIKTIELINDILKSQNLIIHSVTGRVKDRSSLEQKIIKKNKYFSINDITDIIGVRIITHYENEIDVIADLIEKEFLVDTTNSIDKRVKDFDKFGYSSLHYVVTINKMRQSLVEYKQFTEIKVEIQIRSLLQHTWAEIEHDFGYKAKEEIPTELKRSFSRIAALLETADLEFNNLKSANTKYSENISIEIKDNKFEIEINKVTLETYYSENELPQTLDEKVAAAMNCKYVTSSIYLRGEVNKLKYLGINSLQELINILSVKSNKVIQFTKVFTNLYTNRHSGGSVNKGISLFYFTYLFALDTLKDEQFTEFITKFWFYKEPSTGHNPERERLIRTLKESHSRI